MKKIKLFLIGLFIFLILSSAFGAQNHIAVPLNHRVYPILRVAELRGIIDSTMEIRPFSTSTVLNYLEAIEPSNKISNDEKLIVREIIDELTTVQPDNSFQSLAKHGSYSTYSEKLDVRTTMGAKLNFFYGHSLSNISKFDSRNGGDLFIRGDIKDVASFNLNIGIRFDHIDYNLFMKNDFKIPTKGKYDTFWDHHGEHSFYYGIYGEPEVSISLINNKLNIRWASIERDWGVGENNFLLSKDASSINGLELNFEVAPWLKYAFFAGALGKFSSSGTLYNSSDSSSADYIYYTTYFPSDTLHDNYYDNNFSAHRVEIDLPFNIKFGIYESVVYRKRFELGYLNPLSILMFEQNVLGDFDNMLAGFDVQYYLKDYFRVYINAATTEMNEGNIKKFFVAPRNVLSMQAGADINIPFISFSSATLQYTYLAPFFYAHAPMFDGNEVIGHISMVNEGRNIGYPLRPNSDEFLVKLNLNFKNNWDGTFTFKYQRRSGQYGFDIEKWMSYGAADKGLYDDKSFGPNVFEKTIGMEATVNKKLNNYPIKLTASYLMILNNKRNDPVPKKVWDHQNQLTDDHNEVNHKDYDAYPVYKYEVSGPWKGWAFSHSLRIGVNIWL
ncbi:MAG: hypothetical protein WC006_06515 [Bacilli bacterium]|nr:hypothetical protein [Bacilli bacterium]